MSCGTAIRSSQGVMRSIPKSSDGSILKWSRTDVHGPTEVHYPHSTTLPAQEEKSKSAYEERKPLSDFTVAVGQALKWFMGAKQLKLQTRIIFFRRDSPTAAAALWPQR